MAETVIPQAEAGLPTMEEVQKQNAEVALKLQSQDINGHSTAPSPDTAVGTALDDLAREAEKKAAEAAEPEPKPEPKPKAEPKAGAEPEPKPAAGEPKPDDEIEKRATEIFKDSPQLPANASPKSSDAFRTVKAQAAKEIIERERALLKAQEELKAAQEKLKDPVPAEIHKELEDLRTFKARLDVEADPKFKQFDKTISSNEEFIYDQLLKSPKINKDTIEQIKKLGGPAMVDFTKIFAAIEDPTIKRNVENKITDIEVLKFQKNEAIKSTKANIAEYVKNREEQFVKGATQHNDLTKAALNTHLSKLTWLAPKTADAKADDATKKSIEAHNAFIKETQEQLAGAINDDSPEMRAILLTGMLQYLNLSRVTEKQLIPENTALRKENAELKEKVGKLKSVSAPNFRQSGAPASGKLPEAKKDIFSTRAADSLDAIRDQVVAEREAKLGA